MKRPYQNLIVWQEAHKLCVYVYKMTKAFPPDERYRLIDQMCRSSGSIPTNIAEGSARISAKERARFYEIAKGSLEELHYQCLLAQELKYVSTSAFMDLDDRIQRVSYLLHKLRKSAYTHSSLPSLPS